MKKLFSIILFLLFANLMLQGQTYDRNKADSLFNSRKDVHFKFRIFDRNDSVCLKYPFLESRQPEDGPK